MNIALFSKFSPIKKKPNQSSTLFGSPVNLSVMDTPEKKHLRNSSQIIRPSGKLDFSFDNERDPTGKIIIRVLKIRN
jgi:hypothetical protein